jgi:thiol-disulfide isomerase/thioredoxin
LNEESNVTETNISTDEASPDVMAKVAVKRRAPISKLVIVVAGLWIGVCIGAIVIGVLSYTGVIPLFRTPVDPNAPPLAKLESGTLAPEIEVEDTAGQKVRLSDLRGKVVVMNFWATWCIPCVEEMPTFQKYQDKYPGFIMIGIDEEEESDMVRDFVAEMGLTYRIWLDKNTVVAAKYTIMVLPTTYFIDEKGEIRFRHIGAMTEDQLKYYLKTLGVIPQ